VGQALRCQQAGRVTHSYGFFKTIELMYHSLHVAILFLGTKFSALFI
jgi:hypothetical protein